MRSAVVLALVVAGSLCAAARAEETRCDGFETTAGMTGCLQGILLEEDARLNRAYKGAMARMRAVDSGLPATQRGAEAALRHAQRAWITFRDAGCASEAYRYAGGSNAALTLGFCMVRVTQTRVDELLAIDSEY